MEDFATQSEHIKEFTPYDVDSAYKLFKEQKGAIAEALLCSEEG